MFHSRLETHLCTNLFLHSLSGFLMCCHGICSWTALTVHWLFVLFFIFLFLWIRMADQANYSISFLVHLKLLISYRFYGIVPYILHWIGYKRVTVFWTLHKWAYLLYRDDHGNGIPNSHWESHGNPMWMGIDGTIGNGNGKEWESPCMGMGMALISMGIKSHRRMQCLTYISK